MTRPDWKGHCRFCGEYIERGLNGWLAVALLGPEAVICEQSPDDSHEPVRVLRDVKLLYLSLDLEPGPYGGVPHVADPEGEPGRGPGQEGRQ